MACSNQISLDILLAIIPVELAGTELYLVLVAARLLPLPLQQLLQPLDPHQQPFLVAQPVQPQVLHTH